MCTPLGHPCGLAAYLFGNFFGLTCEVVVLQLVRVTYPDPTASYWV